MIKTKVLLEYASLLSDKPKKSLKWLLIKFYHVVQGKRPDVLNIANIYCAVPLRMCQCEIFKWCE